MIARVKRAFTDEQQLLNEIKDLELRENNVWKNNED